MNNGKVVIVSAPSGAGKTTLVKHILQSFPQLEFSISATSRKPRPNEQDGKDYFFITKEEFLKKIQQQEFVEYEEVYSGCFYGTLKSEIERIWKKGKVVLFDVDVKGGVNLKNIFEQSAISIFISPPNLNVLEQRLILRNTENAETLKMRLDKASYEMTFKKHFDFVVVNDVLENAKSEISNIISAWLHL